MSSAKVRRELHAIQRRQWVRNIVAKQVEQELIAGPQPVEECTHPGIKVEFDSEAAKGLTSSQIRKRWPRAFEYCSGCGDMVMKYASYEHYIAGDW